MKAIRIAEFGGAEKLQFEDVALPEPKAGQVRIKVAAAGLNYIDVYQRTGLYAQPLPFTPGLEVAGDITAVGEGVTEFKIGDRVGTASAIGGYAQEALAPVGKLVRIPEGVSTEITAALLLQGFTAHYLAVDTFPLKAGDTALIHAAAGGVGLLLVQIAKMRGARVLATAGSAEKLALARGAGADEVVNYAAEDFAVAAKKFSGGRGVDVVYDSVGASTFEGSLNSLRPRGMLVTFGNASGPVPPFAPRILSDKGSLFITRPTMHAYTQTPEEIQRRADDLFSLVKSGKLSVRIGAKFSLAAAADAHRALEGRQTTGKVLLIP
ncbi:quinone oxidoreductase family protein [Oleiharenicola lentus]|uniref:quinone oxidoreductase family protein n=1 Tax=Oleiharenicola lentus TaxID=2508720 RepID=UPI003F661FA6